MELYLHLGPDTWLILWLFFPYWWYRIASETFKERPRPRKPDYLRESFDVAEISMSTNLFPRMSSVRVTAREEDDEAKPRTSPPRPTSQMRTIIHPCERKAGEESFVFPSSSGEESFYGREGSKRVRTDERGKMPHFTSSVSTCSKLHQLSTFEF